MAQVVEGREEKHAVDVKTPLELEVGSSRSGTCDLGNEAHVEGDRDVDVLDVAKEELL